MKRATARTAGGSSATGRPSSASATRASSRARDGRQQGGRELLVAGVSRPTVLRSHLLLAHRVRHGAIVSHGASGEDVFHPPPSVRVVAPAPSPTTTPGTSFSRLLGVQGVLEELGTPLAEATFVVVDLETTGGSAASCSITEIGAVKVRGGDVLGELQTLVRPDSPIPAFISVLTGITDAMVAAAPRIGAALPAFLEFARGAVLVAHNAPFDVGFLRAAATSLGLVWPGFPVVDTARLARRVVTRDESPDCRLSSLARVFHASTVPVHRALADARATVDVLHGLLERLGNQGVRTVEELALWQSAVTAAQRRKRSLAEAVPHAPGVYLFADARGRILYVGKSTDLRTRVRTYFTAAETRRRMHEMVGARRVRDPPGLRHRVGGRGPRAAAHRGAQAALQQALEVPRTQRVAQAHCRAVPAAVAGARAARR